MGNFSINDNNDNIFHPQNIPARSRQAITIWQPIYTNMLKPAFVFDGKNIPYAEKLKEIGLEYNKVTEEEQ